MTIRLYDKDVDMLDFSAVVKTCVQRENGYVVTLDQTAFFPEGGGQGADHGTLGGVQVLDAHDVHGEVEHLVSAPLAIGSEVRGHVDAARRLDMMQQHSGEHMFSGLVHGLFGYDNVGFHIGTEAVTMDFNGTLTEEDVRRVELLANQAVWRDQPVEAFVPDREALANIEYRSKKEIDGDVRIVRIEGVDTCACCGTHVHTTGAVGQIKVVGLQKYKSGVRVSILCGRRALAYENAMLDQAKAAGHALSVPTEELSGAVERMLGERDRLRAQNDALGMRIFDLLAQREAKNAIRVVACDALPAAHARKAAGQLAVGAKAALVLIPREAGWSFALSSETEDVRPMTKALCAAFGGKGGGPKDMTQGVLSSGTETEIRASLRRITESLSFSPDTRFPAPARSFCERAALPPCRQRGNRPPSPRGGRRSAPPRGGGADGATARARTFPYIRKAGSRIFRCGRG